MKRVAFLIGLSLTFGLINPTLTTANSPKAGGTCSKLNQTVLVNGYSYTCQKSGKKLVWSRGVKVMAPAPQPIPAPSPSVSPLVTLPPDPVTALGASYASSEMNLFFDFDVSSSRNQKLSYFEISLFDQRLQRFFPLLTKVVSTSLNSSTIHQKVRLSAGDLSTTGLSNLSNFSKVQVDAFGFVARQNNGGPQYYDLVDSGPVEGEISPYVSDLPVPILTASHGVATYTIMINNLSALMSIADFGDIVIEEYVTKNNLSMVQESDKSNASKWTQASPATKNSPTSVLATDGLHRWIRAYAEDYLGGKSAYSTYVEVTPDPINP